MKIKPPKKKVAYLTFDDGPLRYTEAILNQLQRYQVKATFFVTGTQTKYGIKMYRRIVQDGHAIGNHTYSHNYRYIYSSVNNFKKDFSRLESLLWRIIQRKSSIFRFPGGSNNTVSLRYGEKQIMPKIIAEINRLGYRYFDWNVDSRDCDMPRRTTSSIIRTVLRECRSKRRAVILFHDFNKSTPLALPAIIQGLKKQGFTFDTLSRTTKRFEFK
jgi:peptidoglycan/xylan/chitin deacetylase (PgdA/CDA1 family)